jgi:excisionase family DNA binding protein
MFDSPYAFEPLLNSEQAAALVKVHPKTLQRYARNGLVAGLRVGKLWRFRASDLNGRTLVAELGEIDSEAEQRYPVLNHSCPQPREE